MEKKRTSHKHSEYLLLRHSNKCIASRNAFFNNVIPTELKVCLQRVLWKPEPRDERLTKVPSYTVQGYTASATDPEAWTHFETVSAVTSENIDPVTGEFS